jgi:hypothetical protein
MDLQGSNQDELRRLRLLRQSQGRPLQVTTAPERTLRSVDGGSVIRRNPNMVATRIQPKPKVALDLKSLIGGYSTVGEGIARALGAGESLRKAQEKAADVELKNTLLASDIQKNARFKKNDYSSLFRQSTPAEAAKTAKEVESGTNKRKFLAGTAEVGLDIVTAGTVGSAAKGARPGVIAAKKIASGAAQGAGSGFLGAYSTRENPTKQEVINSTLTGTLFGGGLTAGGELAGKVWQYAKDPTSRLLAKTTDPEVARIILKESTELPDNQIDKILDSVVNEKKSSNIRRLVDEASTSVDTSPVPRGERGSVPVDSLTDSKIGKLIDEAELVPRPAGTTRLFQVVGDGQTSDYFFTNIDDLAFRQNNITGQADNFQFIDVPNNMVEQVKNKAGVAKIREVVDNAIPDVAPIQPQKALEQAVEDLPAQSNISQAPIAQTAPEGVPSTAADIAQGQIVQPKGQNIKTNLGQKFIDDDYYIIEELKNIEKQTGEKGLVDKFMYESGLARRANSVGAVRFTQSPEIQAALSGLDGQGLKDFNIYAAARRELANAREGLPTSRSVEELQAIVQQGGEFETRYNSLRDYYFGLAKDMRDNGIIGEEKFQQFISDPDYVRLQRDFEDVFQTGQQGKSYQLGSTIASQKRTGSQREVLPVGETALEYTQKIQTEIQRNKVGKGLVEVLVDSGQAKEISQSEAARRNVIKVLDGGSPRYFEVSKDMKEAVQRISPFQLDIVGKIFAAPGRLFRAGTTGLNPVFVTKNLVRDQATQAIMSKNAPATSKYFLDGLWGAMKDFGVSNDDPVWNKFLSIAGDTTSFDLTRNLKKTSQVVGEVAGSKSKYGQAVLHPIRTLEDFASVTEKATRFQGFKGVYEKAIKDGLSEEDALMQATLAAWQNTVDFNRAGQWGRVANLVFPYFNPGVQGSRQLIKRVGEAPAKTLIKGTAFVGVPLATATAWNMSDEDRKAVYNNIPEYEKQNSLILVPPGTKQNEDGTYDVIKIPLPPGVSNLYQPFRRGTEAALGNTVDAVKVFADMAEAFSGPIKLSEPSQNVSTFTPQIIKPVLQGAANRDLYTGNEIVPGYIENSDVEAQDKAFKNTSGTARFIGDILNKSPIKVERFIKDTFGTVGSQALNAVDRGLVKLGRIPEEQVGGQSVSEGYARAFSKAQGIENYNKSEGAKFYDNVAAATKGLNKNEKAAFEGTIMPTRKGFDGVELNDKTYYDSAAKATTWLKYPKVFEASRNLDKLQRNQGKPGDPLFDLPPDRLKIVLNMMANYSPGNYEEKAIRELNPWIDDFNKKRSEYFDKVIPADKKNQKDPMGLTIPQASKELQTKIDRLKTLNGEAKAQFYADNPDVTEYYQKTENYQRAKRSFLGLPQFDRYPKASPEVQQWMNEFNALPKNNGKLKKDGTLSSPARSAWIKANQDKWNQMTAFWSSLDTYKLQEAGAKAVYEGIDFTEDDLKSIQDLAKSMGMSTGQFSSQFFDKETQINLAKLLSGDKSYEPPSVNTKRKVQKVRYKIPKSIRKKTKVKLG